MCFPVDVSTGVPNAARPVRLRIVQSSLDGNCKIGAATSLLDKIRGVGRLQAVNCHVQRIEVLPHGFNRTCRVATIEMPHDGLVLGDDLFHVALDRVGQVTDAVEMGLDARDRGPDSVESRGIRKVRKPRWLPIASRRCRNIGRAHFST